MRRRTFLQTTGAGLATLFARPLWALRSDSRFLKTIGLQLYTLRDQLAEDAPRTLKAVAEAGCSFFKLAQELFKNGLMLPTAEYGPGPNVAASAITPVNARGGTR